MAKYIYSFTILVIVVLYGVSVDCKHKNKSHHMSKNHLKHLHGGNHDKSVKRDHNKHHAHGYQPGLEVNKNLPVILPKSTLDINQLGTNMTKNETTNQLQDKKEKLAVLEIADKSQDKVQQNVEVSSFVESKSNVSGGLNVQTAPLGNVVPNEIINNETASPVLNVDPVPQKQTLFNKSVIKNQGNSYVNKSGILGLETVPEKNTDFNESTDKKTAYFESRNLDVQPVQGSIAPNASVIKESALENSGNLNKQPTLQENPALGDFVSNKTSPIIFG